MRKIKFRAKSFWTGRMVFGDLVHNNEGEPEICYVDDNKVRAAAICPESVAQLVGYDADGNEVYEGDVIQTSDGKDYLIDDWGLTDRVFVSTGKLKKE